MKRITKLVTSALVIGGLVLTLTGCGNNKANGDGDSKKGDITLRISWWGNDDRHKATLEALKAFEAKNPGINVKAEYTGYDGYNEKINTQLAPGTEPDIIQTGADQYTLLSPDGTRFVDLNTFSDELDLSGYPKDALESLTYGGHLNGIPFGNNGMCLSINKTKYDELGVEVPTDWEGFKEIAKEFPDGEYPLVINGFDQIMIYLTQKTGKPYVSDEGKLNYDVDTLAEGFEWYQSLVDAKVTPSMSESLENIGTAHLSTVKQYIAGQYDGVFDHVGGLTSFQEALKGNGMELELVDYPKAEGAKTAGIIKNPGMTFSISKYSKHPKEAAKLLNFLLNDDEGVKIMGTFRGIPLNSHAVKILEKDGQITDLAKEGIDYLNRTDGVMQSPYYNLDEMKGIYKDALEQFALGKKSAKDTAQDMLSQSKDIIEQIKAEQK